VFTQSIVDSFDGKHDIASVYVRLHENKLFLSDDQRSLDYQLAKIKVGDNVFHKHRLVIRQHYSQRWLKVLLAVAMAKK